MAAGNSAEPELAETVRAYAEGDDELLREHAEWALERFVDAMTSSIVAAGATA